MRIETEVTPPDATDDQSEDLPSARITATFISADDVGYDAAVQLFGTQSRDPEKFADALLRSALACAHLAGPEYAWAARRFASYDGSPG